MPGSSSLNQYRLKHAAMPVFEKQSARHWKPIRKLMIKFCAKSIMKRSSRHIIKTHIVGCFMELCLCL
jgi:hypothetical protein